MAGEVAGHLPVAAGATERPAVTPVSIPRTTSRLRRVSLRFGKFASASLGSTVISQLTLMGVYGIGGAGATVASVCAFVAGAIPNFLINRRWAWQRKGRPAVRKELLPYLTVILVGGLASTGLITLADGLLQPVLTDRTWRTLALDGVYVGSYGLLFFAKFLVLDRFVFRHRAADTGAEASPER